MPRKLYRIETEERVHGVYDILAYSPLDAQTILERGDAKPVVYEGIDMEVQSIQENEGKT